MTTLPESQESNDQSEDEAVYDVNVFLGKAKFPAGSPPAEPKTWRETLKTLNQDLMRIVSGPTGLIADLIDMPRGQARRIAGHQSIDQQRKSEQARDQVERELAQPPHKQQDGQSQSLERLTSVIKLLRAKGNDVSLQIANDGSLVVAAGNTELNAIALQQALDTIESLRVALEIPEPVIGYLHTDKVTFGPEDS